MPGFSALSRHFAAFSPRPFGSLSPCRSGRLAVCAPPLSKIWSQSFCHALCPFFDMPRFRNSGHRVNSWPVRGLQEIRFFDVASSHASCNPRRITLSYSIIQLQVGCDLAARPATIPVAIQEPSVENKPHHIHAAIGNNPATCDLNHRLAGFEPSFGR